MKIWFFCIIKICRELESLESFYRTQEKETILYSFNTHNQRQYCFFISFITCLIIDKETQFISIFLNLSKSICDCLKPNPPGVEIMDQQNNSSFFETIDCDPTMHIDKVKHN